MVRNSIALGRYRSGGAKAVHLMGKLRGKETEVVAKVVFADESAVAANRRVVDLHDWAMEFTAAGIVLQSVGAPCRVRHGRAGRIKVIATTGAKRDPLLPELAPVADTVPGYEIVQWWGVALPAGTPQPIVKRLHAEMMTALANADARAALRKNGATANPEPPEQFVAFMRAERRRIAEVGRQAKIAID